MSQNLSKFFLEKDYTIKDFNQNTNLIKYFSNLDDYEIYTCLKHWEQSKDFVLSNLSYRINNRKLLKVKICNKKISESEKHKLIESFFVIKINVRKKKLVTLYFLIN